MNAPIQEQLQELYEANGFPGIAKLYSIVKQHKLKIPLKDVSDFVNNNEVSQLHKRTKKVKGRHITTTGPQTEYQIDLLDMQKFAKNNKGMKWVLICVDIFTRRAEAVAIKTKSTEDTLEGLETIIKKLGKPQIIASDNGGEFKGAVAKWLKHQHILHKTNEILDHKVLGIIDRFSQTLKNMLYKYFTKSQTTEWLTVLPKFIKAYNSTIHSSLGISPNDAEKYPTDTRNIHYKRMLDNSTAEESKIHIGDFVRVKKFKETFDRGYTIKFSLTVYEVVDKKGSYYILDNGKQYREEQLQVVAKPQEITTQSKVDVAKRAQKEHKTQTILNQEGIKQSNRREGLRERIPSSQLEHKKFGKILW